jgi:D-lactate dehydrogenase (quinone)
MNLSGFLAGLADFLPPHARLTDEADRRLYETDETPRTCLPEAVLFPQTHEHVRAIVNLANVHHVPLIPRGAGSGNVGGALPVPGSAVVSFECMRRILEFDPVNRLMVVEPGVVTEEIDRLARTRGLFYAPDPGSGGYCRIGGNLAMNAAGPRAVKYGVTRDHVLGLRAVTGEGREIRTGCRTTKGVTGYDLTRLLVGSEGTLALITEATLRLWPAPESVATMRVSFASNRAAIAAALRVMNQAVLPCALEFMDDRSIDVIRDTGAAADLPSGTRALLMVEADGAVVDVPRQLEALAAALQREGLLELKTGQSAAEIANLWRARKSLSHAVKKIAPLKINEDVVVPVSRLGELVDFIGELAAESGIPIVSFGHAGNGNLHVNLMVHPDDEREMASARSALRRLMERVITLSGTLSGEHGIGTQKREFLPLELDAEVLALSRGIKSLFDPQGILNPGKLLPTQVATAIGH